MSAVGPYELEEELARGGMGVVWLARERSSGRRVALKLLLVRDLDPRRRERPLREGQVAAGLDHPGIVKVHACGDDPGHGPWLAYDLVEGCRTLDQAFQGLAREARVALVKDAARALGHAHARGVVHRDVKPANLLVDGAGRLRVADFGLAREEGQGRLTRTGELVGTPSHMAPEQLSGRPLEPDPRADVWSLGVVLYQALTGELPFQGQTLVELVAQVTLVRFRAPRAHDPAIPPALEAVCLRALSTDPRARQPDGEALAAELEAALAAPVPRRAWGRALVGLAGLAALAGGLAWLGLVGSGDATSDPARDVRAAAPGDVARIESLLLAGEWARARQLASERLEAGGAAELRRLRGVAAICAGDFEAARADLKDPLGALLLDLEEDCRRSRARASTAESYDEAAGAQLRREPAELLARGERCLPRVGGVASRLLGSRLLENLCSAALVHADLFSGDRARMESEALLGQALAALPHLEASVADVDGVRAWLLYCSFGVDAPGLAARVPAPGEWIARRPPTATLDLRFVGPALWFVCAPRDQLAARVAWGERAAASPAPDTYAASQLRRAVLARLSRLLRGQAWAAFATGQRERGEELRRAALARAREAVELVSEGRPEDYEHAQLALAHLLAGPAGVEQAREAAAAMRPGTPQQVLIVAECDLIQGRPVEAATQLERLLTVDPGWPEAWLAWAHIQNMVGKFRQRNQHAERGHAAVRADGLNELGIDWHAPEGIQTTLRLSGWWPGMAQ